jgi:hypothetical protein
MPKVTKPAPAQDQNHGEEPEEIVYEDIDEIADITAIAAKPNDQLVDPLPEVEADPYDPDQKYTSPFSENLEAIEDAREADAIRIQGEVDEDKRGRKRGRSSWKSNVGGFKRNVMDFGAVNNNSHPKYPHLYFRPVTRSRVTERKHQGYRVATKDMIGDLAEVFGESTGLSAAIQRNELILMYHHKDYIKDRERYIDAMTDAQESDLEAAAAAAGMKPSKAGHFGKGKLGIFNERHRNHRLPAVED